MKCSSIITFSMAVFDRMRRTVNRGNRRLMGDLSEQIDIFQKVANTVHY